MDTHSSNCGCLPPFLGMYVDDGIGRPPAYVSDEPVAVSPSSGDEYARVNDGDMRFYARAVSGPGVFWTHKLSNKDIWLPGRFLTDTRTMVPSAAERHLGDRKVFVVTTRSPTDSTADVHPVDQPSHPGAPRLPPGAAYWLAPAVPASAIPPPVIPHLARWMPRRAVSRQDHGLAVITEGGAVQRPRYANEGAHAILVNDQTQTRKRGRSPPAGSGGTVRNAAGCWLCKR